MTNYHGKGPQCRSVILRRVRCNFVSIWFEYKKNKKIKLRIVKIIFQGKNKYKVFDSHLADSSMEKDLAGGCLIKI